MRFQFLGGADEVGASSTLLEVAGKRILIDAGIRMNARNGASRLPDLAALTGLELDVILITHAHTDHIGALPLVHLAYPGVPIITTPPTKDLTRVLLADSLKIMEARWEQEDEIPLYPPHAVEGTLNRMLTVGCGVAVPVAETLTATFVPSGHILGACSISLDTPEGRILMAGDFSVDRQQTVDGMAFPDLPKPHVMVTESTYGNRFHANRRLEEDRLVKAISEVVQAGGKVLVPAFALGRAQEVLLLVLEAQRRGHIARFPVYADGMVRSMCSVYSQHPNYLRPSLRRVVESQGCPFFFADGGAQKVGHNREVVLSGPPCLIVSSSGMLTGGPSRMYAERLASGKKNAIFITGYQDEESPGHALLQLAEEVQKNGEGVLKIDGSSRRVRCQVARYGLSAHADASQILAAVCRVAPSQVVLVHGDKEARDSLSTTFPPNMQVHRPANGGVLEFASFYKTDRSRFYQVVYQGLAGPEAELDLGLLHRAVIDRHGVGQRYTIAELAKLWYGSPKLEQSELLERRVAECPEFFRPDPHRPFLFTAVGVAAKPHKPVKPAGKAKSDNSVAMRLAEQRLGKLAGFELAHVTPDEKILTIFFTFPDRAAVSYVRQLGELAQESGWQVMVAPRTTQKALKEAVHEVLPLTWDVSKVSLSPDDPRVKARVRSYVPPTESEVAAAVERYLLLTGRVLELEWLAEPGAPQVLRDADGRMEQNAAFALIKRAFAERGVAVLNCAKRVETSVPHLELTFASAQVAERHQLLLVELGLETGWELHFRKSANLQALGIRARQLLPVDCAFSLKSGPRPGREPNSLELKVLSDLRKEIAQQVSRQLEVETGFKLLVTS